MKEKLLKKLDGETVISFYKKKIKVPCEITYQAFVSQLNGTSTMRSDVKKTVQDFISEK